MYMRLDYAASKTLMNLRAVFRTKSGYEIPLAFMVTVAGFGAMQFAIDHNVNSIFTAVIFGFAISTVFVLSAIGFITLIAIVFIFTYNFTVGTDRPNFSVLSRGWRIVLGFVVSGAVTAAVFNIFYEGLREVPFIGASCKIIWNASHNPSQNEAMYLESIRRFSRQYSKRFRFTVRNISI